MDASAYLYAIATVGMTFAGLSVLTMISGKCSWVKSPSGTAFCRALDSTGIHDDAAGSCSNTGNDSTAIGPPPGPLISCFTSMRSPYFRAATLLRYQRFGSILPPRLILFEAPAPIAWRTRRATGFRAGIRARARRWPRCSW